VADGVGEMPRNPDATDLVQEILLEQLADVAAQTLLCVAPAPPPAATAWLDRGEGRRLTELAPSELPAGLAELGRYDYAFVTGTLEGLSMETGTALIARLRDVHCHRFAVTYARPAQAPTSGGDDAGWSDGRFRGLTLSLHRRVPAADGGETAVYLYDIDTYNRQREWNTPENWAHPDNFHRWRW
jgi:hypothetical protein